MFPADLEKELILQNNYLEICNVPLYKTVYLKALIDYIPIEDFKDSLNFILKVQEKYKWKIFLFDKRKLETFHQPSMEWYYVDWKTMISKLGLRHYLKLLPNKPWFNEEIVQNAIHKIEANHPELKERDVYVKYFDNLSAAFTEASTIIK